MTGAEKFQIAGAIGFGAIIGWFVYYINRYRTGDVSFADITTVVGAIGGASVLALFPQGSNLFAGYGIGLFFGFFGYFLVLQGQVKRSENFDVDWFIDGRRKTLDDDQFIPDNRLSGGGIGMMPQRENGMRGKHPASVIVNTSAPVSVDTGNAVNEPQSVPEDRESKKKDDKS